MNRLMVSRWPLLLAITAAASWRLMNINSRSLWFDEAFSWQLTRFGWFEMLGRAAQDVHPPLYYILLKPWTATFGDSITAMRLLSSGWFAIALLGAWLLCRDSDAPTATQERSTSSAGSWAMLLLSVSPILFRYSREARMYTQEIALVLLSTWLLLRCIRVPGRATWWFAYSCAAAALAYTHNFGLFTLASQGVFVGLYLIFDPECKGPPWRHSAFPYAIGSAAFTTLLFLPWLPVLLSQQAQVSADYWQVSVDSRSPLDLKAWSTIALELVAHLGADQISPTAEHKQSYEWLGYGAIALIGLVLLFLLMRRDKVGWCIIVCVVGPIDLTIIQSFAIGRNLLVTRYFLPVLTLLLVGVALLVGGLRRPLMRWCVGGLIACVMAYCTHRYDVSVDVDNRREYYGISDDIAQRRSRGDIVLCSTPFAFFPLKYHARGRFTVQQVQYPGLKINHYHGSPVFQSDDFMAWRDVVPLAGGRVWIVGTEGDNELLDKPPNWKKLDEYKMLEAIRWRGSIQVELWEASGHNESPPSLRSGTTADLRGVGEVTQ